MRKHLVSIVLLAALSTACSDGNVPVLPTGPSQVAAPPPPPAPFAFSEPYTRISVGEVVSRRASNHDSECVDLPGWYCHYFRLAASNDGRLDILLTWVLETQPNQPLDLSLTDSTGRTSWSDYGPGPQGGLRALMTAGSTVQLTVWYTFPGVEFELRSSPVAN